MKTIISFSRANIELPISKDSKREDKINALLYAFGGANNLYQNFIDNVKITEDTVEDAVIVND